MVCGSCRRLLSYLRGSKHVKCSSCQTVNLVLEANQVGQVNCNNCKLLLMYPYGAPSVRCSSCNSWEFLQFPSEEKICEGYKYESIVYEGTVYVRSHDQNVTYKLHKGRWIEADLAMNNGWSCSSSFCVIENVFYCCNRNDNGMIDWYDSEKKVWATLKGLKRLPKLYGNVKLADYGGKMMVLWKRVSYVMTRKKTKIWCAEITIEKRKDGEIWGILEWLDVVYKANVDELHLEHALVTTI